PTRRSSDLLKTSTTSSVTSDLPLPSKLMSMAPYRDSLNNRLKPACIPLGYWPKNRTLLHVGGEALLVKGQRVLTLNPFRHHPSEDSARFDSDLVIVDEAEKHDFGWRCDRVWIESRGYTCAEDHFEEGQSHSRI